MKLIEQKRPRIIMLRWLEVEEKSDSVERFESLLTHLKQERKRREKITQQRNEADKSL